MSINLKQNADGSAGLEGVGLDSGALVFLTIPYIAGGATSIDGPVVQRALVVQSIIGLPTATTTNAVTGTVYKAASGTAIGSGTALHSGTYNGQGTAATNQSLTLPTTAGVTTIPAGSRVGLVWSGSPGAAGAGSITLACTVA